VGVAVAVLIVVVLAASLYCLAVGQDLAKQSACIALYYRNTWNVVERTAYI